MVKFFQEIKMKFKIHFGLKEEPFSKELPMKKIIGISVYDWCE